MGIRIFAVATSLMIVATMAIALGIYFKAIPVPRALLGMFAQRTQTEFTARYFPPDTAAYAWIKLTPRGRQMRYVREIWGTLNEYPGFVGAVEDWKSGFAEETGIEFDEDVASWIGPTISAGILDADADGSMPEAAAIFGVRDDDAASNFLETWTGYVSAKQDTEFDLGTYRENRTWVSQGGDHAYSLTGDWLIYTTDADTLHAILDRVDGISEGTLARSDNFRAAQETLPDPRFASVYVDLDRGEEILTTWVSGLEPLSPLTAPVKDPNQGDEWLAAAARWVDRGLVTEWVTPANAQPGLEVADLDDPASLLPATTLGFVALSFDPNLDHWRAALGHRGLSDVLPGVGPLAGVGGSVPEFSDGADPLPGTDHTLAEALDLSLELAHEMTGIDLETEFIAHLAGTGILAVHDLDLVAVREDPDANPADAVVMLSYEPDARDELSGTMNRVAELAQTHAGINAEQIDVGADGPAMVFDLEPEGMLIGGETGYRPGYVLHDQYLTMGTTEAALTTAVALQNRQGDSLASDAEYNRAMQYLPATRQLVGYLDGHRVLGQFEAQDLGMEMAEYEVVRDAVGVLAFGSDDGENHDRGVVVITLFPE